MNTRTVLHRLATPAFCFALLPQAIGQIAPTPRTTTTSKDEQTIVLSPFEVVPDDIGYQAGNTISGSRLNASLKDTAASVSVFTPEFLSDIAANNISEMLAYATNVEPEFEDSNQGYNNPSARSADGTTGDFRVRGIAGSYAIDLMEPPRHKTTTTSSASRFPVVPTPCCLAWAAPAAS
jgi:outer membrane receptor for ferrienterochelin and colicin